MELKYKFGNAGSDDTGCKRKRHHRHDKTEYIDSNK